MTAWDDADVGALPVGTVTLLLADIEGSTRLWEQRADEMPAALAALDETVNALLERHHGVRPVEQGEGDSFVIAFALASDAVAFAVALQRATTGGLLRLRVGLNTGEVQLRDDHNYMGPAINRTARIRDIGHGGQVLLTDATVDIVRDQLPDGAELIDLGAHRLRDLDRPVRVWQVTHPDLRASFPPLRGLGVGRTNLPRELTSFVGRAAAVADLNDLLDTERAVTVTGAGGSGKTRLALHVAGRRLDRYPGGVWLVDFSPVNDPTAVPTLVSNAVGASLHPGGDAVSAIVAALAETPTLLVFDNCEHLLPQCAELVEALLRSSDAVAVMATSREPLGFRGEAAYRVPSLTAPPESTTVDAVAALREYDAVELFVQRAGQARRGLAVDRMDPGVVAEICRRLDGMPLAIELAAARMRVLNAEQIRDGLRDRFRLLTGGARTALPRQQTLQASVDWSYALLLHPERVLLHRLSVFAGGFTIDAAAAVGAGGDLEAHHVFDLLLQLVDKSLVFAGDETDGGRFGLLETVRQYAAGKLVDSGEAEAVRRRHFDYFATFARRGSESVEEFRRRLDPDYDNLRRALQWADENDDSESFVRLAARLYSYWALGQRVEEGDAWLRRAVERAETPALRGRVLGNYAHIHGMVAGWEEEAQEAAGEAVELARASGNPSALVWSLAQYGNALSNNFRNDEALVAFREADAIATEHGDVHGRAFVLFQIGRLYTMTVDIPEATATLREAMALADEADAAYIRHMATACMGWVAEEAGSLPAAAALTRDGLAGLLDIGDGWFTSSVFTFLAYICALMGDYDGADQAVVDLSSAARSMGRGDSSAVRSARGLVAFARGEWGAAVAQLSRVYGRVDEFVALVPLLLARVHHGEAAAVRSVIDAADREGSVGSRSRLFIRGEVAFVEGDVLGAREHFRGYLLGDEPVLYSSAYGVHALRRLAATSFAAGQADDAVRLLAAAEARAEAVGMSLTTPFAALSANDHVAIEATVGPDAFARWWDEGRALSWDEALAYLGRGRGLRRRPATGWDSLTPTERQVVDLVLEGASNKTISDKLFMTVATVKSHLTHSYAKLGVRSRVELMAAASRNSLAHPES